MYSRLLLLLLLGAATIAIADDFSNFRRPIQKGTRLYFTSRGNLNWDYRDSGGSQRFRDNLAEIHNTINLDKMYETDQWRLEGSASLSLLLSRRSEEDYNQYYTSWDTQKLRGRRVAGNVDMSVEGDYYLPKTDLGGLLAFNGEISRDGSWINNSYQNNNGVFKEELNKDGETSSFRYIIEGDAALGYGKVRRASPVYSVHIIERRLNQLGILDGQLQQNTRQRLIDLYSRYDEYAYRYENTARFIWNEIESILSSDPSLAGKSFSAYDWFRLSESVTIGNVERKTGFFIGPIGTWTYTHDFQLSHNNSTEKSYSDGSLVSETFAHTSGRHVYSPGKGDSRLGIGASYHKPLGLRTQLDLGSYFQLPLHPDADGYYSKSMLFIAYMLTERLRASNEVRYSRSINEPADEGYLNTDTWNVGVQTELRYWIEDSINLFVSMNHYHYRRTTYDPSQNISGSYSYERDTHISLGLTYSFIGSGRWYTLYSYGSDFRPYNNNFYPLP